MFAKYLDTNSGNWTTALNNLMTSIANSTAPAGTLVDGGLTGSTGGVNPPHAALLDKGEETGTAPKAYLNFLVFDRRDTLIDAGFVRISTAAREYGQDGAHEELFKELLIKEPGYVYLYLSNDNVTLGGSVVEVFFDDFTVEHVKSPVVQQDDYYAFGLNFNSHSRENSTPNKFKFQGQEHIDDLNLGWDSFKFRNHQPEIGRFFNIDPLAEKFYYNSPYAFSENKVTTHIELEGAEALGIHVMSKVLEFKMRTAGSVSNIQNSGGRLASGNSGNVPSEVSMSDSDRQMVKLGGQISDAKGVTDGVKDIAKTGVRMGAEEAQGFGDAVETVGVVTAQPEIAGLGKGISMTGKGVEMMMDASEGNLTTGDVAYEVGKEVVFSGMGNAAEKGVKAGNIDQKAGDIFQVFVKGWEMLTDWGKSVVENSDKKN